MDDMRTGNAFFKWSALGCIICIAGTGRELRAQDPAPARDLPSATESSGVVLEDFENDLVGVSTAKTGWESNGGQFSSAKLQRIVANAKNGTGAGEIDFSVKPGGWALVQKKVEGAEWLQRGPKAISFWLKGGGAGKMTVELEESYTFKWRKEVPLTNKEWQRVTIPFKDFVCTDKPEMSVPDLVVVKFVCFDGATKILLDDIQMEFSEPSQQGKL
jgi:hypothetical protein